MKGWKDQRSYDIATATSVVGAKYSDYFKTNQGLPPGEFGPFLTAAGMQHQPMANLTVSAWADLIKARGLLWVGTLASPSPLSGLHSRIVEGMVTDGTAQGTTFKIIDPAGGRRYNESFTVFVQKYEDAFRQTSSDSYYQIRHW